jgi:hypothetical protein
VKKEEKEDFTKKRGLFGKKEEKEEKEAEWVASPTRVNNSNISRKSNISDIRIVLLCFQLDFTKFILELSSSILKSSNKKII